ncbi:RICIN domain-containing protein [Promicromonospora sp. Populi]|uniref:RICIN domain-containing protein n=1 Tax=Promicromonospora sp. Populi TaxID=3239420 RepID=UPI0034E27E41
MFASSISRVRTIAAVAITAMIALSMSVFVAAPARAAGYPLTNVATLQCMDASISAGVRLNGCNGSNYQEWNVTGSGGIYTFHHDETGLCLDGSISQGVRLNTCNGSEYQRWELALGSTGYRVLNVGTRTCLDGSISQGVRLNTCNNTDYQRWYQS